MVDISEHKELNVAISGSFSQEITFQFLYHLFGFLPFFCPSRVAVMEWMCYTLSVIEWMCDI